MQVNSLVQRLGPRALDMGAKCVGGYFLVLCRFWSCFGRPVAVMYTAVVGKATTFSLGLQDNPSKGVPDFSFHDSTGTVLLLGEGKVCGTMGVK